jgi:hypothetical protein
MDNKVTLALVETNEQEKKGIGYSNSLFRNNWNSFRRSNRYILFMSHRMQQEIRESMSDSYSPNPNLGPP